MTEAKPDGHEGIMGAWGRPRRASQVFTTEPGRRTGAQRSICKFADTRTPGCPQLLGNETSGIRVKPGGVKCGPNAAPHLSSPPLEGPGPGADLPSLHIFTAPVCNPKHHYLHGFMCTSGTVFSCSLLFPLPSAFSHVSH